MSHQPPETVAEIAAAGPFDPFGITRPDPILLKYYIFLALITGPAAPFVFLPMFFKYHTLKYRFDDSGVAMSWGILFRRETYLTYQRIQDIHLTRNILERWLGLATVSIQTASGSPAPEMSMEGILAAEPLRDFLYAKMRGAKGENDGGDPSRGEPSRGETRRGQSDRGQDGSPRGASPSHSEHPDDALELLVEIRDLMKQLVAQRGAS